MSANVSMKFFSEISSHRPPSTFLTSYFGISICILQPYLAIFHKSLGFYLNVIQNQVYILQMVIISAGTIKSLTVAVDCLGKIFTEISSSPAWIPQGETAVSATDELLHFLDNGGRRSHIGRRRHSNLFRIPERRRPDRDRRIDDDRRKILNKRRISGRERRCYFVD